MRGEFLIWVLALSFGFTIEANAAASCPNLIGTWQAKYKIGGQSFTDSIVIRVTSSTGALSGATSLGDKLRGFCKNGTVWITEESSNSYLESYYFVNGTPAFGRHTGTYEFILPFELSIHNATIKKISKSTTLSGAGAKLGPSELVDPTVARYQNKHQKIDAEKDVRTREASGESLD
ncbi:MAG: hypothetical protein K2Y51_03280 [Gammaproteobacteria bacterium]|nr:hypothetical protein [Gammaproteobacteria bacterium]